MAAFHSRALMAGFRELPQIQRDMWLEYERKNTTEATIALWRQKHTMETEDRQIQTRQHELFGHLRIGNTHEDRLTRGLGGKQRLWKEDSNDIMEHMKTVGFEIFVWFLADTAWNPLNPFISLRVAPVDYSNWMRGARGITYGDYMQQPLHISCSKLLDVLPLQNRVEALRRKYEYPVRKRIAPSDFYFSRGTLCFTEHCELYRDVIEIWQHGNYWERATREHNPMPPHISL